MVGRSRYNAVDARQVLERLLRGGPLHGLPTRETDLELVLAIAAAQFTPQRGYSELEINEILKTWLPTLLADHAADHVTVRRYLVDYGLLRRDPAGNRYQLGDRELDDWLTPDARRLGPQEILESRRRERAERRAAHERKSNAR